MKTGVLVISDEKKDLFDRIEIATQGNDDEELSKLFSMLDEKYGETSLDEFSIYHHEKIYPDKEEISLPEDMIELFQRIEVAADGDLKNEGTELDTLFSELSIKFGDEGFNTLSTYRHKRSLPKHSLHTEPDSTFQENINKPPSL